MNFTMKLGLGLIILLWFSDISGQVAIKIGNNEIGLNQYFTITVEVENDRLKQYSDFPKIEGL